MLKLAKLPPRVPVKLTISVSPELIARLGDYAQLYHRTYGQEEPITELIPAMLSAFLESDRAFTRQRHERENQ